jgi:alpha-L-fucosidase
VEGCLDFTYNSDIAIGTLPYIMYSKGLVFAPAETDMSIRPGWFYHENEEAHSLERLFNTYITSVGNNATFNLNIPPMPNGKLNDNDVSRLKELGDLIRAEFSVDLSVYATTTKDDSLGATQPIFYIKFSEPKKIKYVEIAENIKEGQRVELFDISTRSADGTWLSQKQETTIGSKKIVPVANTTGEIRIRITASRDIPDIEWIKVY